MRAFKFLRVGSGACVHACMRICACELNWLSAQLLGHARVCTQCVLLE